MTNVLRLIGVIYFVAFVSQLWRFFEYQYLPVDVLPGEGLTTTKNGELNGDDEDDEVSQWNLANFSDVARLPLVPLMSTSTSVTRTKTITAPELGCVQRGGRKR